METTFKYGFTFPISGGNKLQRFKHWAAANVPDLDYRLPVQTPIETTAMTIRLKSLDDRARLVQALPAELP
ncbi:MAG: hypothetical protein ACTHKD_01160 [Devosia sp.]|jgi:hypothetical protein|nr:hypothetical protein [Devosia sp.]